MEMKAIIIIIIIGVTTKIGILLWCTFIVVTQGDVATGLGVLPPSSSISWLPVFVSSVVLPAMPSLATSSAGSVVPTVVSLLAASTVATGFPVGTYLGEGLLPVLDKLVQKIVRLEYVEMRELMPENWVKEDEEGKKHAVLAQTPSYPSN